MNELVLTPYFKTKLNRLSGGVGHLNFAGADLSSYENIPIVAIVGTRKPTPYGKLMTEKLAEELAKQGVVIVSGLALGIDSIAHSSALKSRGRTIAVLPSGLEHIYPATNKPIADRIVRSNGTLLSEYPPEHKPRKVEFLKRNRIIAALSNLVVIPEAAAGSGSLNTAKHTQKMGIPVCVVPGNVTSPMSSGTNYLLKQGARAVTETADVLKLLGIDSKNSQLSLDLTGDTPEETLILHKISLGFTDTALLLLETSLSTVELQTAMTILEVQGRISQDTLGQWRLA